MLKPQSCKGCPLYKLSDGFSEPEGEGTNGVCIIGEALGYEEFLDGLPFRPKAQAGSKLEEAFRLVEADTLRPCSRQHFKLWNIIACKPPGNELAGRDYEHGAIAHCETHFKKVVNGFTPAHHHKTILGLGNTPLRVLTGFSGEAYLKESISNLRGFVLESKYGPTITSYHPSFIRRGNSHLTPILVEDIKRAIAVARGEFNNYPGGKDYVPPDYQEFPSLDEAQSFYYQCRDNSKLIIATDIETMFSAGENEDELEEAEAKLSKGAIDSGANEIRQIQFSVKKGRGIAFPFQGDYINLAKKILALRNQKAGHNWYNFDAPRLQAKGITINGLQHDTMWMFKHYQPSLPRGLQHIVSMLGFPFPWKHLFGSKFEWYGCADVDAVHWILAILPKLMYSRGVWEGYKRYVLNLHPIMSRASREVGIPVDIMEMEKVRKEFKEKRIEINDRLQESIPDEIKNISPRRKDKTTGEISFGYIKQPKEVEYYKRRYDFLSSQLAAKGKKSASFNKYLLKKCGLVLRSFTTIDSKGESTSTIKRYCKLIPFKASKDQLTRYLRWKQGQIKAELSETLDREKLSKEDKAKVRELRELVAEYEIPLNPKTHKETTAHKELEEIYFNTGDTIIQDVMDIRSIDTNLNNYIPNWTPGADGRVHTTFGYTAASGQFDSRAPNVLNCSKHTEYGQIFRGMIVAPKGYRFIEFDKKSFHVATMGYCANDRDYIRFSQIDPHSIFTSYIMPKSWGKPIDLSLPDDEIRDICKWIKKKCKEEVEKDPKHGVDIRQKMAKPTVLGNQLGLGPIKLQHQNRRYIATIAEAKRLQSVLAELFPKVTKFKEQIRELAHKQTYLLNEFGRIQYFYEVFSYRWNKKARMWLKGYGDDSEKSIAFYVQSRAFGMLHEEMFRMEEKGYLEEYGFCNSIHDSLMFLVEDGKVDRCLENVGMIMYQPCPLLVNEATGAKGLKVGVEASLGLNWKNWDKDKNPEGMQEVKLKL